jgi:hypothetical protein
VVLQEVQPRESGLGGMRRVERLLDWIYQYIGDWGTDGEGVKAILAELHVRVASAGSI